MHLRGFYINLDNAVERHRQISEHLISLGLEKSYQRFPARGSDPLEAEHRGLKVGELGLWKSWIALLEEQISAAEDNQFDYLHILEDDAELSNLLPVFINSLGSERCDFDLLFTEMYLNPELWMALRPEVEGIRNRKSIALFRREYFGCASSVLIPRSRVTHIYSILHKQLLAAATLLPLDNFLRILQQKGELSLACTMPFLSSVRLSGIKKSTIQINTPEDDPQQLTQELNALLRRHLSLLRDENSSKAILHAVLKLARAHQPKQLSEELTESAIQFAIDHHLPQYRYEPRLQGQPGNLQTKPASS